SDADSETTRRTGLTANLRNEIEFVRHDNRRAENRPEKGGRTGVGTANPSMLTGKLADRNLERAPTV
ncbi:MAG TPA: hypothetical protein DDY91_14640, partial [Planctomycetaceae bacterium]|nr:hypothetical protein [Planctomycetaceae bacterium]